MEFDAWLHTRVRAYIWVSKQVKELDSKAPIQKAAIEAVERALADGRDPRDLMEVEALGIPRDLLKTERADATGEVYFLPPCPRASSKRPIDFRQWRAFHEFARDHSGIQDLGAWELGIRDAYRKNSALTQKLRSSARHLPEQVIDAMVDRVNETADYRTLRLESRYTYTILGIDEEAGFARLNMRRDWQYIPSSLMHFDQLLRPSETFEIYEWNQCTEIRLNILDTRDNQLYKFPMRRTVLEDRTAFRWEIDLDRCDEARPVLKGIATEEATRYLVQWSMVLNLNVVDRDIIVSHVPVDRPTIVFNPGSFPEYVMVVGDSPGLKQLNENTWRVLRTIMPREVLAVRFIPRNLQSNDVAKLSFAGTANSDLWKSMLASARTRDLKSGK